MYYQESLDPFYTEKTPCIAAFVSLHWAKQAATWYNINFWKYLAMASKLREKEKYWPK